MQHVFNMEWLLAAALSEEIGLTLQNAGLLCRSHGRELLPRGLSGQTRQAIKASLEGTIAMARAALASQVAVSAVSPRAAAIAKQEPVSAVLVGRHAFQPVFALLLESV